MHRVWQSLAWKEWHEHKWKLAALSGVLCGATAIALLAQGHMGAYTLEGVLPAIVMGMVPLTMFVAVGEAAGENTGRTLPFLQSLPVPMWKAAVWKLVFGAVTCLLSVLLTLLLIAAWYYWAKMGGKNPQTVLWYGELGKREIAGIENSLWTWNLAAFWVISTVVLSLLTWTAALGVNRKSEVEAGAVALVAIVAWWTLVAVGINFVMIDLLGFVNPFQHIWLAIAMATGPGGIPFLFADPGFARAEFWWIFAVVVATHAVPITWYLTRFGRVARSAPYSSPTGAQHSARAEWLGLPRRSPLTAIIWKQFRESQPIAMAGLAAILMFFVANLLSSSNYYTSHGQESLRALLMSLTLNIGFLAVLIIGIGVFDRDLSPRLHTFWRSRPINPNLWYWTKLLTGLGVAAAVFLFPLAVALVSWYKESHREPPFSGEVFLEALCFFLAIYALAVTSICLVRVTLYSAVLCAGVVAIGTGVVGLLLGKDPSNLPAIILVSSLTVFVLATLVGWWAVRRDVGWRK